MKSKTILFDGRKSVDIWGDKLDGWTIHSGEGMETTDSVYYKLIPTLYRAVQIISYYISTMPFALMKGKKEYDKSDEWKNNVGFLPNPYRLLQLIVGSLEIAGNCYLFRERNQVVTKALHYCLPSSVKVELDEEKHKIDYFERMTSKDGISTPKKYYFPEDDKTPFDFVYFWLPDPYIELGPAVNFPAKAAMDACGVLLNMDLFASNFFEHGAVKVTLLTVAGMPAEAERQKLSDWWRRVVSGVKNAFGAQVINADAVKPIVIGEGIKELENVTIGEEKREDIAIALGIPMSILFANAANYATSKQDVLNFLTQTVIPLCQFIEGILNEQLFEPLGLEWHFLPETLDAMQEDEVERSTAMGQFITMVNEAESIDVLLAAFEIYGMEVSDSAMAMIKKAFADKEKKAEVDKARADELARQAAEKPPVSTVVESGADGKVEPDDQVIKTTNREWEEAARITFKSELDKWQRKAINAMKKGNSANVDFVTTVIPGALCETIMSVLGNAKTEEDVKQAFTVTGTPEMNFTGDSVMSTIARELKRANDFLEIEMKIVPPIPQQHIINIPEQPPSTFNITMPEQKPPDVIVNVPKNEQPAPIINVNVPKQDAPVINVNVSEKKSKETEIDGKENKK